MIDAAAQTVAARIQTGRGHHEIVFSAGDRYAFVSNRDEGSVSVIDIQKLEKIRDLSTGPLPISLAYSPLSRAVYVADAREGVISVVDGERHEILARIEARPGLGPLRFTPDGRWGMAVNSIQNAVHVVDAATNRLRYTIPVDTTPYQISFTGAFAYVRSLGSERVSLIQLALLGKESMPAPNTFPAGALPPRDAPELGVAGAMIASPKESAAYVLSPADKAIYYYMEGMNAPSGSFQTYGQNARGIEIIDRSLREREPGVYSTRASLTQIWVMICTALLVFIFFMFFKYSRMGLAMRGTANNQETALLMGISTKRVFAMVWGIAFVTAAIAGIFLANVMVVNIGLTFTAISAFPAIILGGLESIPGAIIGGLAIGVIRIWLEDIWTK